VATSFEPLGLQGDGGDPGGGGGEGLVAVQLPGMPGCSEGEGLAGPGLAHDQGDAGAALADITDHALLIVAGGGMGGQRGPDGLMGHLGGLLAGAAGGGGDQPLLCGQQLRGGPAPLLDRPIGDHADRPLGQEPVGQVLELGSAGPGQLAAEGGDDVLAGEGGRGRGEAVRAGQPVEHSGHRPLGHCPFLPAVLRPVGHLPDQGVRVHAPLGRFCPPPSIQGVRCLVPFRLAGRVDGPLDQPRRPLPPIRLEPLDRQVDLAGALGEQPDQLLGHATELPVAMGVRRRPLHAQRPDKLVLVGGAVDGVRSQAVAVQVPTVQCRPASVRPLDAVGHHQMGVQQRVALPGGPVVEPDRQQPLAGHVLDTAMTAANS
jgi:hypothetical protein